MSHYSVAVILKDIKDLEQTLAPFNEDLYEDINNPNAKWDWWVLCEKGEYARFINNKYPLGYAKIKDMDFNQDQVEYDKAIRFWEIIVEDSPLLEDEEKPNNLWKKDYYIKRYQSKEYFAKIYATPHYYAFLLDGEWNEKEKINWVEISDYTKNSEQVYLDKFLEIVNNPKYQDYYLAIVDCHI